MKNLDSDRRSFLRALGATGAFLPLLGSARRARGAGGRPTRFISWLWPNGVSDAKRRQRELGDIAIFTKPFHFDELIGELRRALEEGKTTKPTMLEF